MLCLLATGEATKNEMRVIGEPVLSRFDSREAHVVRVLISEKIN